MKLNALIKKSKQNAGKRLAKNIDIIESVLIVWDATQPKTEIEELKTFGHEFRQKGKNITFLAYHPIKKLAADMQPNDLYRLCCKSDFSYWQTPKSNDLKKILEEPYDLFINGCLQEHKTMHTLAAFTKSRFRIGPYITPNDENFYELMVQPNGADPCENYLIEIGKYLKKIH
ncbi:MAG: hypothetical protein V4613_08775 [Bacteroidota bacterium]